MRDEPLLLAKAILVSDVFDSAFKAVCHSSERHPFSYRREFEFGSMLHVIARTDERTGETVAIRYPHKLAIMNRFADVPRIFDNIGKHKDMVVAPGRTQGAVVDPVRRQNVAATVNERRRTIG